LKRAKRWINVIDVIERIFQEYALEKEKQNVGDYDDLLIKMLQLTRKLPGCERGYIFKIQVGIGG